MKTLVIICIIGFVMVFSTTETKAQTTRESVEHFELGSLWVRLDSAINADIQPLPCPREYRKLTRLMKKSAQNLEKAYFADIKNKKHYSLKNYSNYLKWVMEARANYAVAKINYDYLCEKAGIIPFKEGVEDHHIAFLYSTLCKYIVPDNLK